MTFNKLSLRKLPLALTLIAASSVVSQQALAARSEGQQALLESSAVTTGAIAGAAAGGPIGFMVGGLVGIFVADQTRKGNDAQIELEKTQGDIEALAMELDQMNQSISEKEITIAKLEQQTINKLALQVLFGTGADELDETDAERIEVLANHLLRNDDLIVNLSGHTDPRGTDEYNNVLALERAKAVAKALTEHGVSDERIILQSFGASFSKATPGQYDQYARDRRVDIEVLNRNSQAPMASVNHEPAQTSIDQSIENSDDLLLDIQASESTLIDSPVIESSEI